MISKKRIKNRISEIIRLLRCGQTGFSHLQAKELAARLEQAIEDTGPISLSGYFYLPYGGKIVRCCFARLPEHIKFKKRKGIYLINQKYKAEFLRGRRGR